MKEKVKVFGNQVAISIAAMLVFTYILLPIYVNLLGVFPFIEKAILDMFAQNAASASIEHTLSSVFTMLAPPLAVDNIRDDRLDKGNESFRKGTKIY